MVHNVCLVDRPEQADLAIVSINSPAKLDTRDLLSAMCPSGSFEYDEKQKQKLKAVMDRCPTIVYIKMNRASVIPKIAKDAAASSVAVCGKGEDVFHKRVY